MESKTRVRKTIRHQEPDRVPLYINATKWVVSKLKKELGISTDSGLLKALNIDFYDMRGIDLNSGTVPRYTGPPNDFFKEDWRGEINSFWGINRVEIKTESGWVANIDHPPLHGTLTIQKIEQYPWPDNDWFDYSDIRKDLEPWQDFSIVATGASVFQHATYIRGMDCLMMDMLSNPELANSLLDKVFDFYTEYYRRMFEAAGDLIDIFAIADDLGMQNSLLVSPEMFEEYIAPRIKKLADLAHGYGISFLLHSCGYVESLIPRLIELGVDILDPIQPECMDPIAIKEKFGKHICLRGGISVQNIVSRGNVDDVRQETRRIIDALKPGGGYIFAPGHPVLQDDIPVENILAMYDFAFKYGRY